jgi:hypothetical protein
LLGIPVDLAECDRGVVHDPKLGLLVQRYRGVKPPRFLTFFEVLAWPLWQSLDDAGDPRTLGTWRLC